MTALLLLASLLAAAQSSGPRNLPRAPFVISATLPRVSPLSGATFRPLLAPAAAPSAPPRAAAPSVKAALPKGVPAPSPASEYGVVPQLDAGGVFRRAALPPVEASTDRTGGASEADAASAGALFDGSLPRPDAGGVFRRPPVAGPAGAAELPHFLSVPDPADRAWIADVVNVARGTKTGARILEGIEKLALEQKRPLTVIVASLRTNNGEYVYDWDVVRMNSAYRKLDPFSAAPIFMHELQHVLQKVEGYPVEALELELEAFLVSLRMLRELGIEPDKTSFEYKARQALRKSAEAYVRYVSESYTGNRALADGGVRAYRAALEKDLRRQRRAAARLDKQLEREKANVAAMRATGQPQANVDAYEKEIVGGLSRRLAEALTGAAWAERDLSLLDDPEAAARYRRYARKVRRAVRDAARRAASN